MIEVTAATLAAQPFLIQCGHVSLDMQVPGEGPVIIDNIGIGVLATRLQSTRAKLIARSRGAPGTW